MQGSERSAAGAAGLLVIAVAIAAATILALQWGLARLAETGSLAALAPAIIEAAFNLALFGLLALFAGLGLWLAHRSPTFGRRPLRGAALGTALGILGLSLAVMLSWIAGVARPGAEPPGAAGAVLGGTIVVLFQTGVEELYFRGWLQPSLQRAWGRWWGLAASAIAFAALHFVAGPLDAISIVTIVLAGVWFGLLADRSGGLALPIAAHFGWNWAEELLLGVAPNPGTGSYGALVDLDLVGMPLWGGSATGMNASVATALALFALVIVTIPVPRTARGAESGLFE